MQITKTYNNLQPELLYYELKDFLLEQGMTLGEDKLETFSTPSDSAMTIFQGSLTFRNSTDSSKDSIRVRLQGVPQGETKLVIEVAKDALSEKQISDLQEDLDFFLGSYEVKSGENH